jgi:hypothetical protein
VVRIKNAPNPGPGTMDANTSAGLNQVFSAAASERRQVKPL